MPLCPRSLSTMQTEVSPTPFPLAPSFFFPFSYSNLHFLPFLCLLGPLNRGPPTKIPGFPPSVSVSSPPQSNSIFPEWAKGDQKKKGEIRPEYFSRACFHPLFSPFVFFSFPLRPLKVIVIASSLAPSFPLPYTPPYLRVLAWGGRWREGLPEAKEGDGGDFLPPHFRTRKNPHHIGATFPSKKIETGHYLSLWQNTGKGLPPPPLRKGASQPAKAIINHRLRRKTKEGSNSRPSPFTASQRGREGRERRQCQSQSLKESEGGGGGRRKERRRIFVVSRRRYTNQRGEEKNHAPFLSSYPFPLFRLAEGRTAFFPFSLPFSSFPPVAFHDLEKQRLTAEEGRGGKTGGTDSTQLHLFFQTAE